MIKKLKKALLIGLAFSLFSASAVFAAPNEPAVNAESAILVEKETGTVLYEKNADKVMYPASMTKILTSMLLLDHFEKDEVIVVGTEINDISLDSSKAGHTRGEYITVENLVRGLIIPSGNDTAAVAAAAVAKKVDENDSLTPNESLAIFSTLMNRKAEELGCERSNFENPHGYHDDDHYTTANDMAKITLAALEYDLIMEIAAEKSYSGNGLGDLKNQYPGVPTNNYTWKSHNMLIAESSEYNYQYATGMKTGFTNEAGDCVAASAEKDGIELVAIIFNSEDPNRWLDAASLFDYGFENYGWHTITTEGKEVCSVGLTHQKQAEGDSLILVSHDEIKKYGLNDELTNIVTEFTITAENLVEDKETGEKLVKAPIAEGDKIGELTYKTENGEIIDTIDVYSSRSIEKANIFVRAFYTVKDVLSSIFSLKGLITIAIVLVVIILILVIIKLIKGRRRSSFYGSSGYTYKYKGNKRRRF